MAGVAADFGSVMVGIWIYHLKFLAGSFILLSSPSQ